MLTWLRRHRCAFRHDRRGTAAVEFALAATLLVYALLNAVDFGYYMYRRMEVENAAEAGAQAVWKTCSDQSTMLPATTNCTGLNTVITTAIQNTSLGSAVSLASGSPTEAYYCVNASNTLQSVGSLSAKPTDCSSVGKSSVLPGDYIQVSVTCAYTPLFSISLMTASGITSINMTTWMRLA